MTEPNNAVAQGVALPVAGDTLSYTAPSPNTTATAVYQTGSTTNAAGTQTLAMAYALSMETAVVTTSTITVTYNEAVSCDATSAGTAFNQFTYEWTGTVAGGSATGCSSSGDVLTLTGTFHLDSGGNLVYAVPGTNSETASVYATTNPAVYAGTQTLNGAAVS
jgi:hypothetical protein